MTAAVALTAIAVFSFYSGFSRMWRGLPSAGTGPAHVAQVVVAPPAPQNLAWAPAPVLPETAPPAPARPKPRRAPPPDEPAPLIDVQAAAAGQAAEEAAAREAAPPEAAAETSPEPAPAPPPDEAPYA